ncbi:MAG TPA: hypothetical protein PKD54_12305 [Pirellulaceae bacterium]|nr:hypothetical protein [Pirellulaceae bacterium]
MSLFEDPRFIYRDTFFVLFQQPHRPTAEQISAALAQLGKRYEVSNVVLSDGQAESFTVQSPQDYSAMDVAYVDGEDVGSQIRDVLQQFRAITLTGDDAQKLKKLSQCDARFDIYHFERIDAALDDTDQLDPGGLLLVVEKLSEISHGVGLDPQSMSLM